MKQKYHLIFSGLLFVIWSVACFVFFQFFYKYHLFHRLDLQLFLYSKEYLLSYFQHPAWLSSIFGDYLTQFFFFNYTGALVITSSILAIGLLFYWASKKIFPNIGKKKIWTVIILFLSLCLMTWEALRNCGINYKLSSTLTVLGGIALFFVFFYVPKRFKWIAALLLLPLSYWLFGYGMFFLLLLIIAFELSERRYFLIICYLALTITIPLATRQMYSFTIPQAYQYPSFALWNQPDFDAEEFLAIDILSSNNQWAQVTSLTEKSKLKSTLLAYYFNLSHGIKGSLPDVLSQHWQSGPNGLFLLLNRHSSFLKIWCSNEIWFQLGDMTLAEHSTLLGMIFSPEHRSVRMVKRLAEINMINGDTTATMKYLRILRKTWLYRSWAEQRIPGKESTVVKKWLATKRAFIYKNDILRDDVNPQVSLRALLESNKKNKLALDYLLCYDLLTKDITSFMNDYDKYKLSANSYPEKLYAQGLLIGLTLRKASLDEIKRYNIPEDVYSEFSSYLTLYKESVQKKIDLISCFRNTYWYYYNYAKMKHS